MEYASYSESKSRIVYFVLAFTRILRALIFAMHVHVKTLQFVETSLMRLLVTPLSQIKISNKVHCCKILVNHSM